MATKVQPPKRSELPVHAGLQSEGPVPEVVPTPLIQDHQVDQPAAHPEQEMERNVISCQVVHANKSGVLPSDLKDFHASFFSCLEQTNLKYREQRSYYSHLQLYNANTIILSLPM